MCEKISTLSIQKEKMETTHIRKITRNEQKEEKGLTFPSRNESGVLVLGALDGDPFERSFRKVAMRGKKRGRWYPLMGWWRWRLEGKMGITGAIWGVKGHFSLSSSGMKKEEEEFGMEFQRSSFKKRGRAKEQKRDNVGFPEKSKKVTMWGHLSLSTSGIV